MTINGGGKSSLLQLHPKTTLRLWGKVGKGETPFPKSVTPSRICEESPLMEEGKVPSSNSTQENIKRLRFLGLKPSE